MFNDISHVHKPNKMVQKIHKSIKREWCLYEPARTLWHRDKGGYLKPKPNDKDFDDAMHRIAVHLWYPHCGMTLDELKSLVELEYNNFRLWEMLDASTN